jgi:hypothetical protein
MKHELVAQVRGFEWHSDRKLALVRLPNARVDRGMPVDIVFHLPADGLSQNQRLKMIVEPDDASEGGIDWT